MILCYDYYHEQNSSSFVHTIPITVTNESISNFKIEVNLQGASDIGLAYPPQKWVKTFSITQQK